MPKLPSTNPYAFVDDQSQWFALDDNEDGTLKRMVFPAKSIHVENAFPSAIETPPCVTPRELIERCRADYNNTFFGVSNFFRKLVTRRIDKNNLQQMLNYMIENPRSRTTRVYVNLYIEKLKPGAYKDFWQKYMKTYHFSFYQKSDLINKLLKGSINNYQDIADHALGDRANRSTKLLRN